MLFLKKIFNTLGPLLIVSVFSVTAANALPPTTKILESPLETRMSREELDQLIQKQVAFFNAHFNTPDFAGGTDYIQKILTGYDPRISGRCTQMQILQKTYRAVGAGIQKIITNKKDKHAEELANKIIAEYRNLLDAQNIRMDDFKQRDDCAVFEYEFSDYYETPATVANPGFWWWTENRQAKTFFRLKIIERKPDGSALVEATLTEGKPKGVYQGTLQRSLHSTQIEINLLRKGADPYWIEGTLEMSGLEFVNPVTGLNSPHLPQRVLKGTLTFDPAGTQNSTLKNTVTLIARDSDREIANGLGVWSPAGKGLGEFLQANLVVFEGPGVGSHYGALVTWLASIYQQNQKDHPTSNPHPALQPILVKKDSIAILTLDYAGDVQANVIRYFRALLNDPAKEAEKDSLYKKLGLTHLEFTSIDQLGQGSLEAQLPGKKSIKLSANGFSEWISLFRNLEMMTRMEWQALILRSGMNDMVQSSQAVRDSIKESYKALGPTLDRLLGLRSKNKIDVKVDLQIQKGIEILQAKMKALDSAWIESMQSKDPRGFQVLVISYFKNYVALVEWVSGLAPAEKKSEVNVILTEILEARFATLETLTDYSILSVDRRIEMANAAGFFNFIGIKLELNATALERDGSPKAFHWNWNRPLHPFATEVFTTPNSPYSILNITN